jgi:hypothetical protein
MAPPPDPARAGTKRQLLSLLGGARPDRPIATDAAEAIAEMAVAHRLEPLLAWRIDQRDVTLPECLAAKWRAARRRAGLTALAQQAALRLAVARLAAAGMASVALKGVRLAWRDYPEPALRPMRDIDLLVAEGDLGRAAVILRQAGFLSEGDDPRAFAAALTHDKHLPPLHHAELGTTIELHHRLSDPPGRRGYRVPQLDPAVMLARAEPLAVGGATVFGPAADDLLAHLVTHALYGHRLDCGPLVLADIHFLATDPGLDWARFNAAAQGGGWSRAADLLLALTARWFGPLPATFAAPPEATLAAAEDALLADPAGRAQAELAADLVAARSPRVFAAMVGRRLTPDPQVIASEGDGAPRGRFWAGWVIRRLARLGRRRFTRATLGEARQAAAVIRWVEG